MNAFAWSGLLTLLSSGAIGWVVYRTNPGSPVHQRWATFCISVAVWGLGALTIGQARTPEASVVCWRLGYVGVVFIPLLFYRFVVAFLGVHRSRLLALFAGLTGLFSLANTTPLLIPQVRYLFGQFYYLKPPSPLYVAFFAMFAGVVVLSHVELARALVTCDDPKRRVQIRWLLTAMAVGFGGGLTEFFPVFGLAWYPYGNFIVALYPLLIGYAIVKYQLMNVRLVITRAGVFLGTYLIVLGAPLAVGWWGGEALYQMLGFGWWVVPVGLCMALASVGPFAYSYLRRQAEDALLRRLAEKELEASTDALTGLLMRRAFLQQAAAALAKAAQAHRPCALLMVDLDHFKQKNDAYGHLVGDVVLQETAHRLSQTLRAGDLIGRYGGEEFILLLPQAARAQALEVAERLRRAVAQAPIRTSDVSLPQTLSIGLASCPEDGAALEALIAKADAALYAAKRAGRDRVEIAS